MKPEIITCSVWCVGRSRDEIDLGLDEGDSWMPFAFDLNEVVCIKLAGETEFLGDDKACITFKSGFDRTVDIKYNQMVKIWKTSRGGTQQ